MHKKYIIIAAFFAVVAYFAATSAFAQEAAAVPAEDLWGETVALAAQIALAVFGLVLSFALSKLAAVAQQVLPPFLNTWLDKQRQDDIHKAAMTIVNRILLEGGDPKAELNRVKDHIYSSAKDAISRFRSQGRTPAEMERIIENIALSKV